MFKIRNRILPRFSIAFLPDIFGRSSRLPESHVNVSRPLFRSDEGGGGNGIVEMIEEEKEGRNVLVTGRD